MPFVIYNNHILRCFRFPVLTQDVRLNNIQKYKDFKTKVLICNLNILRFILLSLTKDSEMVNDHDLQVKFCVLFSDRSLFYLAAQMHLPPLFHSQICLGFYLASPPLNTSFRMKRGRNLLKTITILIGSVIQFKKEIDIILQIEANIIICLFPN